ncbi:hypothetical protein ABKV19_010155 [Rosa sericea]
MDTKTNPIKLMFSLFFLCLYLNTPISLAADTITANQSISGTVVKPLFQQVEFLNWVSLNQMK